MSDQSSLVEVLRGLVDKELAAEVIDGDSIADVLDFVDLDIADSPVIVIRGQGESQAATVVGRTHGGDYIIEHPPGGREIVPPGSLRIMRARYLLTSKARQRREMAGFFQRTAAEGTSE